MKPRREIVNNVVEENKAKKKLKQTNKNAIYLVKWSGNWADEIDFTGYSIMNAEDRIDFEKFFGGDNEDKDLHIYFGTNEDMDCTRGEYLANCEFIEITEEEKQTLEKYIKLNEDWSPNSVWECNCDNEE